MSALEVDQPQPPKTGVETAPISVTGRRFALSLRERRVLLAATDFAVGAIACVISYVLVHRAGNQAPQPVDVLLVGAVWVVSLLLTDGYAFQIPSSRAESGFAVV